MRRLALRSLIGIVGALSLTAMAEGTPVVFSDLRAGDPFTGTFSFPIAPSPPDRFADDPMFGWYDVAAPSAQIAVNAGGARFSSDPGAIRVTVFNQQPYDWFELSAQRRESLTRFDYSFRFPPTYLSSDAFPTWIDATAAGPIPPAAITGALIGGRTRVEWMMGFAIDPIDLLITLNGGILTGSYSGTLLYVTGTPVPNPVPEPASFILMLSGLFAIRALTKSRRAGPGSARTQLSTC